jgi:iron complex outermembrane receptor protein
MGRFRLDAQGVWDGGDCRLTRPRRSARLSRAPLLCALVRCTAAALMLALAPIEPAQGGAPDHRAHSWLRHLLGMHANQQQNQRRHDRLAELSLAELGSIEVTTVSKEPEQVWRTPAAVFVLTQEDIRRSGATSIPEVLRLVPGVEVGRIDSNKWSIGIRGFQGRFSRDVLVLIDGRSVFNSLVGGVYWEVQDVLLEDVDRIEVIRGPGGTIWGADAVNAVINIITKRAKETQGGLVQVGGGNVDQALPFFRYGGGKGKSLNYRIYGKGFSRGPEFHPDHHNFDRWQMGQAGFRADWDSHRDNLTVEGGLYDADDGQRLKIGSYSPPFSRDVEREAELWGGSLLVHWQRNLSQGSDVQVLAYYDRSYRHEADYEDSRDRLDLDFIHHLALSRRQDFIWGLEARADAADDPTIVPTILITPSRTSSRLYSAFVQDTILIGNQFSLTLGSKLWHATGSSVEAEPTLRLLWTASPRQSLWAAVTRAVATPSQIEQGVQLTGLLANSNPPVFFRLIGNHAFSSERMIGYEAGYRSLLKPSLYLDLAAFHNHYGDLESAEPGKPFLEASHGRHVVVPFFLSNGLKGTTDGFEIAPQWRAASWWQIKGSYSYLHMDLQRKPGSLDPGTAARTEGQSPHHQWRLESWLSLPKGFEFDQAYRYVSALPAEVSSDAGRVMSVPAYGTASVRLGWEPTRHIELSVTGDNLLQPRHVEFRGDPGPLVGLKRSLYGQISLRWEGERKLPSER